MGKADGAVKEFMSDKQNFADAFNLGLFGAEIVQPDTLEQVNPNVITAMFKGGSGRIAQVIERTLDDARIAETVMQDGDFTYLLLGMQYQMKVHYAMPLRSYLETAMLYGRQVNEITARKEKLLAEAKAEREKRRTAAPEDRTAAKSSQEEKIDFVEFMSGMGPEDKLNPVIVMTLYLGQDPWSGPRTLLEMLPKVDGRIRPFLNDYRLHLVTPEDIADEDAYRKSEFGKLMYALKMGHRGKDALLHLADDAAFETVQVRTLRLVNTLLNANIKIIQEHGGYANMCKAVREIQEEITEYKEEITGYREEITGYREEITGYREEITGYKDQLAQKDGQLAQKDGQLAQKDDQIAQLERELAQLKGLRQI